MSVRRELASGCRRFHRPRVQLCHLLEMSNGLIISVKRSTVTALLAATFLYFKSLAV